MSPNRLSRTASARPWCARILTLTLLAASACATGCTRRDPDPRPAVSAGAHVDRAALHARLAAHRAQQIERLHAYAAQGEFPRQSTSKRPLHVFRDDAGRLCAVANLIAKDGLGDLVDVTARTRNDLAMADVEDGPILEWALASGLTREEIVRIQAPAPPLLPARAPRPLPPRPADVARDDVRPMGVPEMTAAIRAHVRDVESELRAQTETSLDVAVERLAAAGAARVASAI